MWTRFANSLKCPGCGAPLRLRRIEGESVRVSGAILEEAKRRGLTDLSDWNEWVETGLLLCEACRVWHPIEQGLPVVLPFATNLHKVTGRRRREALRRLGAGWHPPNGIPKPGEEFVQRAFSREWLDYSYDGVVWTWSYAEREALFQAEMGKAAAGDSWLKRRFLEIGCGLGLVTACAARGYAGEAVGADLSLAVLRAARQYRDVPYLHFVQASLWGLPFAPDSFDEVYTHGVLHHTHSTRGAFEAVAEYCAPGGRLYVWVYGPGSIYDGVARRAAYGLECMLRPLLARAPAGVADVVLTPLALGYCGVNRVQRLSGSPRHAYTFQRALHAARDRFTPLYAHRTTSRTLASWFRDAGFERLALVGGNEAPKAARETFGRNPGLRGWRSGRAVDSRGASVALGRREG